MKKPKLTAQLDKETFLQFYYLKEELTAFLRCQGLPVSGGKKELTDRIAQYLDTKTIPTKPIHRKRSSPHEAITITSDSTIEADFICTEAHRTFFKAQIGPTFTFRVPFQKWLKANTGKTYGEAIQAYHQLLQEKKKTKSTIDSQFEYNTYIRDFFADNKGRSLSDAIICWNYKKDKAGHHRYEREDLIALASPYSSDAHTTNQ